MSVGVAHPKTQGLGDRAERSDAPTGAVASRLASSLGDCFFCGGPVYLQHGRLVEMGLEDQHPAHHDCAWNHRLECEWRYDKRRGEDC